MRKFRFTYKKNGLKQQVAILADNKESAIQIAGEILKGETVKKSKYYDKMK